MPARRAPYNRGRRTLPARDLSFGHRRQVPPFLILAAFAAAVLVCIAAFIVVPACTGGGGDADASQAQADEPFVESEVHLASSTPKEEWKQGEMPYLYQFDPAWADELYSGGPIWEQGCGPTSLAMVYIYLTGDADYGPLEMAQFATENGYSTDLEGSSWTLMSEGASQLGLYSEELPADGNCIISELEAGNPVICIMAPGDFTTTGHYIVLSGVDEGGNVVVHDPNSVVNSHVSWDVETIVEQANNIWSFSLA